MIPNEINKQIENDFFAEMQEKYRFVYTDYDDPFNHSAKTIQECLDKEEP